MEECEESGCREKAVKSWRGRKVCEDHYNMYNDEEEKIRMSMS